MPIWLRRAGDRQITDSGSLYRAFLHSFFAEIAKGLTNVFRRHGYGADIATAEEDPNWSGRRCFSYWKARRCAGCGKHTAQPFEIRSESTNRKVPYVLIDRRAVPDIELCRSGRSRCGRDGDRASDPGRLQRDRVHVRQGPESCARPPGGISRCAQEALVADASGVHL